MRVVDPIKFGKWMWPDVTFYREQRQAIYSAAHNDKTFVPAGNMLGKDFVAAFIILYFFMTRHPVRVVTTSADYSQLEAVLWGEMRRFIQTAAYPLDSTKGGAIVNNHLHLKKLVKGPDGQMAEDGLSYVIGRVAAKGEGLLGHHIAATGDGVPRTLFVADEASGVEDISYKRADTWADRMLIIGNCYQCNNFFRHAVKGTPDGRDVGGDIPRAQGDRRGGFYRKVIRIRAEDSPNVRLALAQRAAGREPTGEMLVPGVLPYDKYVVRRSTWDPISQTVGLDALFYDGAEILLFPTAHLDRAAKAARLMRGAKRKAEAIGIDTAEGGDKTAMVVGDRYGIIERVSKKTPDTDVIPGEAIAFWQRHDVSPSRVVFDRGGGGKQHADRLRARGYPVKTMGFGEAPAEKTLRGIPLIADRIDDMETRYTYVNRRAQLYGEMAIALESGYGIPEEYGDIRSQLAPIPKKYDREGRLYLPPKNAKPGSTEKSLVSIIGHSPDEADAAVLMLHEILHAERPQVAGAF